MKRVATVIDIAAPPGRVWDILTDFPSHPQWNPFIKSISGPLVAGASLVIEIAPPGGKGMRFKPKVLVAEPRRELRWRGKLLIPGLFDGEHIFKLEPFGGGTRFHHGENFSGLFVAMMSAGSFARIEQGFFEMNQALKKRAET